MIFLILSILFVYIFCYQEIIDYYSNRFDYFPDDYYNLTDIYTCNEIKKAVSDFKKDCSDELIKFMTLRDYLYSKNINLLNYLYDIKIYGVCMCVENNCYAKSTSVIIRNKITNKITICSLS